MATLRADSTAMSPSASRPNTAADSELTAPTNVYPQNSKEERHYSPEDDSNSQLGLNEHDPVRYSAGFFDSDPETRRHRTAWFRVMVLGSLLTTCVIFGVLSIYWGALWKLEYKIHVLDACIVDFDQSTVGQFMTQALVNASGPLETISYRTVNASQFPNGPSDLVDYIVQENCWAAVAINPGATAALNAAVSSANSSYNGSTAMTAYAAEARNENSYPIFLLPGLQGPLQRGSAAFAAQMTQQLASTNPTSLQRLSTSAPNVLTQPIFFTVDNVRPFDVPVATAVDFVGLIYLLIISFVITMMNYNARHMVSQLVHHLRISHLLAMRVVAPVSLYFYLSLMFSLLSLAFQTPFNRQFGHSGFVIFWMMNWLGMCALGLAMEAMITLLTPAFIPFFLILWIISNVSVCFYPIPLLPGVYRYGYATPFYNVSRTVRCIVFGTKNQIGLNFGVQIAWIAVSCCTIVIFQYFKRRPEEIRWRRENAELLQKRAQA